MSAGNHPYNDILGRWKDKAKHQLGKHEAANAVACERVLTSLLDAGMEEELKWALWMIWWRVADSHLSNDLSEVIRELQTESLE